MDCIDASRLTACRTTAAASTEPGSTAASSQQPAANGQRPASGQQQPAASTQEAQRQSNAALARNVTSHFLIIRFSLSLLTLSQGTGIRWGHGQESENTELSFANVRVGRVELV